MTGDPRELTGLLLAYIDGDVVAKKIVLDWLEEHNDPRREAVALEEIDWDALACSLTGERRNRRRRRFQTQYSPETNHIRFQLECARVGADTRPEIRQAVSNARRQWLRGLFPELEL